MRKLITFLFCSSVWFLVCTKNESSSDAYGTFEVPSITVSSESSGKIMYFDAHEGDVLSTGDIIACIDTALYNLSQNELYANIAAILSKEPPITAQIAVVSQQMANLSITLDRTKNMLDKNAATQQQFDDLVGQYRVLDKQKEALIAQKNAIGNEIEVVKKKIASIEEQKKRCIIQSPISGTVLETFVNAYELITPGKPLLKVADLSECLLKVYVTAPQLSSLKLGQTVTVLTDSTETSFKHYPGTISWISDEAEFTPKIIQTKQVRASLVYAVKIRVANDGYIKIGMPGEVRFHE